MNKYYQDHCVVAVCTIIYIQILIYMQAACVTHQASLHDTRVRPSDPMPR